VSATSTLIVPRHPELVSGSIGKLAPSYRRQAQTHREINPVRIFGIYEVDLPSPTPVLQLLLTRNRRFHRAEKFKMHQPVNRIFGSVPWNQVTAMFRKSLQKVRSYADVKRAVKLTRKNINAWLLFLSHRLGIAAKWTLKQVQGDGIGRWAR
jgi:hypothetical protein